MICKKCNSTFADKAKFCPKCGTKAEEPVGVHDLQMKKCPKCGAENPLSAKFCKVDGYNFPADEGKVTEKPVESDNPVGKVLCPKCGAAYEPGVKFCRKDGTSLQKQASTMPAASTDVKTEIKQATATPQRSAVSTPTTVITDFVKPSAFAEKAKKAEPIKTAKTSSKTKIIAIAAGVMLLLILGGVGSYLYFTGYIGSSPEKVATKINDELKGKGINVYCEIDKNWTATLKGTARNVADKDVATNIIKTHKEIKDFKDEAQMQLSSSEVRTAIDTALRDGGIRDIHAEVDETLTATLQGVASNDTEKESAMKIAAGLGKAKDVRDNIQIQAAPPPPASIERPATVQRPPRQETRPRVDVPRKEEPRQQNIEPPSRSTAADPAKVEGEINRALRNAGLSGITAEVGDDMSVTLKGSTVNPANKSKAFDIANSFSGIRKVRDRIFVVR